MTDTDTAPHGIVRSRSLRDVMTADHREMSLLFEELVAAFRDGERDQAAAMFTLFERRLEAHLAFEDATMLPRLRRDYPVEAAQITADHRAIRERLIELGISVDLHLARASWVTDFVELLREHAEREDALVYVWAGRSPTHLDTVALLRSLASL
jgi:hemerythrin-like domain-containing protein